MRWPDMRRWYILNYDLKRKRVEVCRMTGTETKFIDIDPPTLELLRAEYTRGQQEAQGAFRKALGLKK